ncbi:hypothetical protein CAEBREN_07767 [Caenorhabditis brenneri]|uniref:Uncharacterized protein n=1 Tax=Caenorhabditis brenneri TaxID=135651 RepID=G0MMI7_CAEBE|nr:hypothetical protein CAEBREN_07767 [Caenorhabditis brenneri]
MSYENVKILLEYLEPNKRIQIGFRCPSIRGAERAAPLRINNLSFEPGMVWVNRGVYFIVSTKKYHVGNLSEVEPPGKSGIFCAVDEFGNEIPSDAAIVTPGDVKIGEVRDVDSGYFERWFQQIYENTSFNTPEDELEYFHNNLPSELLPYYYRRYNMVVPYEQMIHVTFEATREEDDKSELYVYNKPYSAAVKQLGKSLFGDRRGTIHVKEFLVSNNMVIRLPLGVQFHIEKLHLVGNWSDEIIPIIQSSSFPLKHLQIHNLSLADISNPIVNCAELLTISTFDECIALLPNQRVRVQNSSPRPTPENFISYIEKWIEKKRSIGTCHEFIFDSYRENLVRSVMEAIFDRFGGELTGTGLLVFSMTETSKMEVSNKKVRDVSWELTLTVVAA